MMPLEGTVCITLILLLTYQVDLTTCKCEKIHNNKTKTDNDISDDNDPLKKHNFSEDHRYPLWFKNFPEYWPCQWVDNAIPYAFNFYTPNPKRLVGLVTKGIDYLQERSCLRFEKHDSLHLATISSYTYLYFTYSGAIENCCLPYYSQHIGMRTVLITPRCSFPAEVAHAILHGLGLRHGTDEELKDIQFAAVLFHRECPGWNNTYNRFVQSEWSGQLFECLEVKK